MSRRNVCAALALAPLSLTACSSRDRARDRTIVFSHQNLGASPHLAQRIAAFERAHPGVRVVQRPVPGASDALHQYYLTALEGGSDDIDVLVTDVIWVAEFARAGWIADLTDAFPTESMRSDFLGPAAGSVIHHDRTFAVPWFLDVGLLFYRSDLLEAAPASFDDVARAVASVRTRGHTMHGYVWQGRQSEGLVCVGLEAIWGCGGEVAHEGRFVLDAPGPRAGLATLRELIVRGETPRLVLSSDEDASRRAFGSGEALLMRNWPYAWTVLQRADSRVRGRVAIAPLPTRDGSPGSGALGGWQLAVNANAPRARRALAIELIRALTNHEAGVELAVSYGLLPPRASAYDDPRVQASAPFLASLRPHLERARPRPATAYYNLVTDTLQSAFSAAVTGIRTPAAALSEAQRLIDRRMGVRS